MISAKSPTSKLERWKKIHLLLPERQKNAALPQKMPPDALPTTHPPLPMWVSRDCRVRNNFVPNTASAIGVWVVGTPIFLVKRASNSQDTVDYIVQRAARKNSSGFPGLSLGVICLLC